jgi:biopolymer transport protein ExbD
VRFGEAPGPRRLISLTPLIDVVFILLVFFMLAASYLDWRGIDLRVSGPGKVSDAPSDTVVIRLLDDGSLTLNGAAVAEATLDGRVAALVEQIPGRAIVLRPQGSVTLQRAIDLFDRLKAAGAANLTLSRER